MTAAALLPEHSFRRGQYGGPVFVASGGIYMVFYLQEEYSYSDQLYAREERKIRKRCTGIPVILSSGKELLK